MPSMFGPFGSSCSSSKQIAQLQTTMNAVLAGIQTLIAQGKTQLMDTSVLIADVTQNTTVINSAVVLINGMAANEAALAKQLAAAIAANDPVALAAAQKAIDDSAATLASNSAALAAAVTANTPAAPAA